MAQAAHAGNEIRSLAVGDVDGNGDIEIAVASTVSDNQWFVLEHTGATRTGWPKQTDSNTLGYAAGCFNQNVGLADIDGDGRLELVGPNDTHYVSAFHDDGTAVLASGIYGLINGQNKPWARVGFHYLHSVDLRGYANCGVEHRPNFADSAPTIVDVDGDGTLEIVIVGNQYNCGADPYQSLFHMPYVLRADRTRWAASGFDWTDLPPPPPGSAPLSEDYNLIETVMPNPVVADLDGDGRKEILFASYDGRLHAYWLDRTQHGSWPYQVTKPGEGFIRFGSPPAVVDLDGNGQAEVILTTWTQKGSNAGGQLLILSSTGTLLQAVDLPRASGSTWDGAMAAPTVADIDGDADLEVVVGTAHTGLVAYDLPGSSNARVLWATGRGNLLRSGTLPRAHTVTIEAGPAGTPNPVASGLPVVLSVTGRDSAGHALRYAWSASCPSLGANGTFDNASIAAPTWTAPANATGSTAACTISVTVSDGTEVASGNYTQQVTSGGGGMSYRRYFAEGATIPPFDCRFALANPGTSDATVAMRFLRNDGQAFSHVLVVPALTRRTVDAKTRRRARGGGVLDRDRVRRARRRGSDDGVGAGPRRGACGDEHRRARHDLVPRRGRHALGLRALLHDPEPEPAGGVDCRALPAARRPRAAREGLHGARGQPVQHLGRLRAVPRGLGQPSARGQRRLRADHQRPAGDRRALDVPRASRHGPSAPVPTARA